MEALLALAAKAFDGVAPLISAILTTFIMRRYFEHKESIQMSKVEANLRDFLSGELKQVRAELHECEKAREEGEKTINKLEARVRELEWLNTRTTGEH